MQLKLYGAKIVNGKKVANVLDLRMFVRFRMTFVAEEKSDGMRYGALCDLEEQLDDVRKYQLMTWGVVMDRWREQHEDICR